MVKPRKASAAVAAREKARERAESITRRNDELIELAAGYFVAVDRVEAIEADLEEKIAVLRTQAEAASSAAREEAADVVRSMASTGEPKRAIAERLGISVAEVSTATRPVGEPDAGDSVAQVRTEPNPEPA